MRFCDYRIGEEVSFATTEDPNDIYPATSWQRIVETFALASSGDYALGSTGGAATHTLTVNEMPSHTHTQNAHNHTQNGHSHTVNGGSHSIGSSGSHNHQDCENAMQWVGSGGNVAALGGSNARSNNRNATTYSSTHSHNLPGHTHSCNNQTPGINNTTAANQNTGGGKAHNNMPPYETVNRWKRVA